MADPREDPGAEEIAVNEDRETIHAEAERGEEAELVNEAAEQKPWEIVLPEEGATEDLGAFLAGMLVPGDLVALSGGLGGGKTVLARAMVRELTGDPDLEVPSPTFTLMQPYDGKSRDGQPGQAIVHADLYRLRGPDELIELGFDEITEAAITLVEWPERMEPRATPILTVELSLRPEFGEGSRFVRIDGLNGMRARLDRARALRALLGRSGWDEAERHFMQGDASARAYERLVKPDGASAVLMISPPAPTGRRCATASRTAPSSSSPKTSTPSSPWIEGCGRSASRPRRSTPRTGHRVCSSSRISAGSL